MGRSGNFWLLQTSQPGRSSGHLHFVQVSTGHSHGVRFVRVVGYVHRMPIRSAVLHCPHPRGRTGSDPGGRTLSGSRPDTWSMIRSVITATSSITPSRIISSCASGWSDSKNFSHVWFLLVLTGLLFLYCSRVSRSVVADSLSVGGSIQ
jgi:hypothetical protein